MKVNEAGMLWNKTRILRNMKVNSIKILVRHLLLRAAKTEIMETKYFTDNLLETKHKD